METSIVLEGRFQHSEPGFEELDETVGFQSK
jgi:hypothetical protein